VNGQPSDASILTGFDTAETSYGTGVRGMPDRLDPIGGALQVVSRKGGGTTIEGQIPTPKE
jgi:signal transduction histidine kinase